MPPTTQPHPCACACTTLPLALSCPQNHATEPMYRQNSTLAGHLHRGVFIPKISDCKRASRTYGCASVAQALECARNGEAEPMYWSNSTLGGYLHNGVWVPKREYAGKC
ncbi:hypothetical protein EJ04DRAFT_511640 [Polyplosphaeria fusca]|uniref:Uncharacterized protein n=1 Tax=Polyplosphaeria fusca TaxID=682080 RepID=A0A9P4V0U9_9PLEO|nr:hypothetical protein EJ04DRAFT_511640 [Polyplosphaeria fusca]